MKCTKQRQIIYFDFSRKKILTGQVEDDGEVMLGSEVTGQKELRGGDVKGLETGVSDGEKQEKVEGEKAVGELVRGLEEV